MGTAPKTTTESANQSPAHQAPTPRLQVTQILQRINDGHPSASDDLLPLVYEELRRLAQARLAHESPGQTLQPTALVHEAYLRLIGEPGDDGQSVPQWDNRGHFFASAAEAMRRILVERARRKASVKHGGGRQRQPLSELPDWPEPEPDEMIALDAALTELSRTDQRLSQLVMLRYFAGLNVEQTAEAMSLSPATVKRDWSYARAWLFERITATLQDEPSRSAEAQP